jgi:N-acyl-phosphatidylethanolamine-hydrolysing phospholipase D
VLPSLASALLVAATLLVPATLGRDADAGASRPFHHRENGFRNLTPGYDYPMAARFGRLVSDRFRGRVDRGKAPVVVANDGRYLRDNGTHPTVTWIGHATTLVQLDGSNILTDPIWSDRPSPVPFAGPRRLVPPGLRFEDLPPVHAAVISHDHYDHLDLPTVRRLAREHGTRFFVPLRVGAWLRERGVENVVELDWWESADFRGLTFTCTPAQHSSGRWLHDQYRRLWASWVVGGETKRLFFGGDTGYDDHMKEIGRRLGPIDLAILPIGGYKQYATGHPNHVNPEEALRLFQDVGGRLMLPMHWGTFDRNRESFREPPDRLLAAAAAQGLEERVLMLTPGQMTGW